MGLFIIRRILMTLVVIVIVSIISFMLLHLIPGDPVITMLGLEATKEQVDNLRAELWLDRPVIVQYFHWFGNILRGDFGRSVMYRDEVRHLIARRLPVTFHVASFSLLIAILFGITMGVTSAVKRGTFLDQFLTLLANIGIAVPVFWLGIMGVYLFGLKLGWLPVQGYTSPFTDFWKSTRQLIMPAVVMSVVPLSVMARQSRSSMLEVIRQDYIRTARSKGLLEHIIIMKHALKNALIPIVTLLGLHIPTLFGGSVLTETVFNIPGMGRLLVQSVFDKDFPVVQATVLCFAIVVALANLLVDISYGWFDPRIRY